MGTEQKRGLPVESTHVMSFFVCAASALSVAILFYSWRSYHQQLVQQHYKLRERVTYMLWVAANTLPEVK